MANLITGIISITIGAVLLSSVFISTLKNTSTCSFGNCSDTSNPGLWTTSEIAMWGLLTLIGIVGLLYGVLAVFGLA